MDTKRATNLFASIGLSVYKRHKKRSSFIKKVKFYRKIFFNSFRLESNLEEIQETERILLDKTFKTRELLSRDYNLTKEFLISINKHVKNRSNAIFMIFGLPNSGKSEIAQAIAKLIEIIAKKKKLKPKIHIFFSITEIPSHSKEFNEGDIIIVDEMPSLEGQGAINIKKSMDNITKIVRQKQLFFIFNSPEKIVLKVINYYVETYGKNMEKKMSRLRIYDKKFEVIGCIYLTLHKDEVIRQEYLKLKAENIEKILETGGQVVGKINKEQLRKDIVLLLTKAKEIGEDSKAGLDYIAQTIGFDGDTHYVKTVVNGAYIRVKNGSYEYDFKPQMDKEGESYDENDLLEITDEEPDVLRYAYRPKMSFAEFVYESERNRCSTDVAKARSMMVDGKSYREITSELNRGDEWVHRKTDDWKSGHLGSDSDCWKLLEKWFALTVGANPDKCGGNEHLIDVDHNNEIYSIKLRFDTSNSLTFYQSKDFKPEYEGSKIRNKCYHLILLNPFWRTERFKDILIDPNGDDKVVVTKNKSQKMLIIGDDEDDDEENENHN